LSTGVIFDIKRFAVHDGPGVRTTVFLKGCPLRCWSCHNPESQSRDIDLLLKHDRCDLCGDCLESCPLHAIGPNGGSVQIDRERCDRCGACVDACLRDAIELAGRSVTVEQVMEEVEKDRVYYDEGGGGVTFSGGEPLYQPRFLIDLLRECARRDIQTVVDTSGFASPTVVQTVAEWVDAFLYDLKLIDNERHLQFTGATNRPILANLRWLSNRGARVRVRFPLIPNVNDDETNVRATGAFVASLPTPYVVDILPYHRLGVEKYHRLDRAYRLADTSVPSDGQIFNAVRVLEAFGLDVTVKGEAYVVER
jgi:pyruvate formate lyase activating enzyme